MNVLVTGAAGQLGSDMVQELVKRGHMVIGCDKKKPSIALLDSGIEVPCLLFDITNRSEIEHVFRQTNPDAVVHCAAWTAVDAAEASENRKAVQAINVTGTKDIADFCQEFGATLLYLSTDYVFDGQGELPWQPDETNYRPLNVYGQTKLEGERAITERLTRYFIVRIAWVFGLHGSNFVKTMLKLGKNHDHLTVVNDQIGTPTYTKDLVCLLADMLETDRYGYYHATNEGGYLSWYDFAVEIFQQASALGYSDYDPKHLSVMPVSTAQYQTFLTAGKPYAARPFNSRLEKKKLVECGFMPLPDWKDALARYLQALSFTDL